MALYMKMEGIEGESKDKDHPNWTDVHSCSFHIHKPGGGATGQSRRRGVAKVEDITFTKEYDKGSPKIQEAVLQGKVMSKVEIHGTATYGDARATYLKLELKNVSITSHSFSASSHGDAIPTETFSLNFDELKHTYTEYDSKGKKKGNVEMSWKVEEGTK